MIQEEWKLIEGIVTKFGYTYSISNLGRVRNNSKNIILTGRPNKKGYLRVSLNRKDYIVHRLVATYFVNNPNQDEFNIVNHKDLDKTNNIFTNLEWCDDEYNKLHAKLNGALIGKTKGSLNGNSKLTEADVFEIWSNKYSAKYVSEKYGLTHGTAKNLINQKAWKHLIPDFIEIYGKDYFDISRQERMSLQGSQCRKLSDYEVLEIYNKVNFEGFSQADMTRLYGVNVSTVHNIVKRKSKYVVKLLDSISI